ncbi:MAG: chromosome segregation protein SMC [bacterium]|nr:chromosome segregation protein SMC [bacterium]
MRLSKLELAGFKSFMNKATLEFGDGITAVLGPNGCGKSNIVDAMRWVLGEQSAKLLRGAKMENVIFDGTKKRAPMGFAEVAMTFSGASDRLSVDWEEITLKRRVTRGGGSEYYLNNQPYRLHEIRDMLAGTGLGNHVYSIIEQDMIKDVLAEAGDKRRLLFEEASGVLRYKLRRKDSLAKLKNTEGDLTRLDDILEELGKTVRSLKYQVSRARSYQRLQGELKEAEIFSATSRAHDLWIEDRKLEKSLAGLGDESQASDTKLAMLDDEIARRQAELVADETRYTEDRDVLERELDSYRKREEEMAVLDEKCRAEQRQAANLEQETRMAVEALERLTREREELEQERKDLEVACEVLAEELAAAEIEYGEVDSRFRLRRNLLGEEKQFQLDFARNRAEAGGELERLSERLAQTGTRLEQLAIEETGIKSKLEELRSELAQENSAEAEASEKLRQLLAERENAGTRREEIQERLGDLVEERETLRLRRGKATARVELLEKLRDEGAGYPEGTRRLLLEKETDPALRGALAELIRVKPAYREAVETALSQALSAVVVNSHAEGLDWLHEMRESGEGRALILTLGGGVDNVATPAELSGLTSLISLIDCDADLAAALSPLLHNHYLAESVDSALTAIAEHAEVAPLVVTPEGFMFRGGLMAGGASEGGEGQPLGRAEEIEALRTELTELEPELARLEQGRLAAESELGMLRVRLRELEASMGQARQALAEREMARTRLETRLSRFNEEEETLEAERQYQTRQLDSLKEAITAAERRLHNLEDEGPRNDVDLPALETEVIELEKTRDAASALLAEKKLESASARGRRENLALREENLERSVAGQWARRKSSEEGGQECRRLASEYQERSAELREMLTGLQGGLNDRREDIDKVLAGINEKREMAQELQTSARVLREEQREKEQARHAIDLERNTITVKIEDLQRHLQETWEQQIDPALDPALQEGWRPPEGTLIADLLEDLRNKIKRLGTVNLLALEEFEEKNERFEFLSSQKEDLVKAREGLLETIDKINREAKQRFNESFKIIRKNFIEIFNTLFEHGEADLVYTTGDDPLQADIVITAKPKDKNISSVQLLSSGEKTLTALSLLFAVYLSKPSPFCIFDEVDAPLDDANIARFLRLVREFSDRTQFVLITHNKKTMEVANHLYGITMQESGISRTVSVAFDDVPDDLNDGDALAKAVS